MRTVLIGAATVLLIGGAAFAQGATARPAGAAATSASATTSGPLAIGAKVCDSQGVDLGRITRLTTNEDGQSIALVRKGQDVLKVPTSSLSIVGGVAVSTLTRSEIEAGPGK